MCNRWSEGSTAAPAGIMMANPPVSATFSLSRPVRNAAVSRGGGDGGHRRLRTPASGPGPEHSDPLTPGRGSKLLPQSGSDALPDFWAVKVAARRQGPPQGSLGRGDSEPGSDSEPAGHNERAKKTQK